MKIAKNLSLKEQEPQIDRFSYNMGDKIYLLNDKIIPSKFLYQGDKHLKKGEYHISLIVGGVYIIVDEDEFVHSFEKYEMPMFFSKREVRLMKLKNIL